MQVGAVLILLAHSTSVDIREIVYRREDGFGLLGTVASITEQDSLCQVGQTAPLTQLCPPTPVRMTITWALSTVTSVTLRSPRLPQPQ